MYVLTNSTLETHVRAVGDGLQSAVHGHVAAPHSVRSLSRARRCMASQPGHAARLFRKSRCVDT